MKFINTTDIPDEEVREIIRFVIPNGLLISKYTIRLNNSSRGTRGYFLESNLSIYIRLSRKGYPYPRRQNNDSVIRRPKRKITFWFQEFNEKKQIWQWWYITRYYESIKDVPKVFSNGGYISSIALSREESLVHTLAHELRHYWQMNHPGKRGKIWGARGKFSERDADAYAIRKTREWRRLHCQSQTINWNLIEGSRFQGHGISIENCPLVKSLRESSNIHKIQEYEEGDMAEQLQNQDLD